MNYRVFLTVLAILTIISTVFICANGSKLHKSVLVYNSEFKITPQAEIEVDVTNIPTVVQTQSSAPQPVKVIHFDSSDDDFYIQPQIVEGKNINFSNQTTSAPQSVTAQNVNINPQPQTTKPTSINVQGINNKIASVQTKTSNTNLQNVQTKPVNATPSAQNVQVNTPQIDLQKIMENNKKIQAANTTVTPTKTTTTPTTVTTTPAQAKSTTVAPVENKVATQTPPKAIIPEPVKELTPQEEEIAWQIWRSNLQNKIMQDAKLPNVPQGTIFKFTFDVDKYGKISNVYTSCTNNSQYTPYAIQYIAPVIKSYQGRAILNFPEGSKRVTTSFVGSFKVSSTTKYSTTQDYKDTERIIK